jgi:hypothetical protein
MRHARRQASCPLVNARHAQITGAKPWYELVGQAATQIDLGRNSSQIADRVTSTRRSFSSGEAMKTLAEHLLNPTSVNSNSDALRRFGDEDHEKFFW